jgi:uncharacterized membrane protein
MNLYVFMKLLHVLAAFWFLSGLVGRDFAFWRAGKATSVQAVQALLQISDFFERYAVIPVSMAVFLFGLIVTFMQKWPLFGFLQGSPINWLLLSFILFLGISLAIGPLRLVPRRKQRSKALEEALVQKTITPELTATLNDPVVLRLRMIELGIVVLIIILMVTKPF